MYYSAQILDIPPPEIAAAGHDRCIIPIKPKHVGALLNPDPKNLAALYAILDDRERFTTSIDWLRGPQLHEER